MRILFGPPLDFAHWLIVKLITANSNDLSDPMILFETTFIECLA